MKVPTLLFCTLVLLLAAACAPADDIGPWLGCVAEECGCDVPIGVVEPAAIDFGAVRIGEEATRELTIRNAGGGTLIVEQALFQGSAEFRFVQLPSPGLEADEGFIDWLPPLSLGAGESTTLQARYAPRSNLGVSGRIVFRTNGSPEPNQDVWVSGEGTPHCPIVTPGVIELGYRPIGVQTIKRLDLVGCDSGHRVFQLELTEDSHPDYSLDLEELVGEEGLGPSAEAPIGVGPGESRAFYLVYAPQAVEDPPALGTIVVHSSGAPAPVTVEVSATGKLVP